MSGENKFKRGVVEEIVNRVTKRIGFQKDMKIIRKTFDIPENGFINHQLAERWWKNKLNIDFYKALDGIIIEHKLPLGSQNLLESYILINDFNFLPKLPNDFFNCEFEEQNLYQEKTPLEKKWDKSGKKYIRVYINEDCSLPMTKKYLETHWQYIKKYIFLKTKGQKIIRRSRNDKRDELVWYYYQQTREKLGLKRGDYKDIKVAKILDSEHGVKISPENVRIIALRVRRSRYS